MMKSLQSKDLKVRKKFFKDELKKRGLKFLFINLLSQEKNVKLSYYFLKKFQYNSLSSKVKLVNRCVFTNRGRGIIRKYSMSRLYLKAAFELGVVPGFKKAVW